MILSRACSGIGLNELINDCKNIKMGEEPSGDDAGGSTPEQRKAVVEAVSKVNAETKPRSKSGEAPQLTRSELVWTTALSKGPTFAIMGSFLLVFGLASLFLEHYVVTATANVVVFGVGSYVVFSSYFVAHYVLNKYSSSYKGIPEDKQFYVLSNLIKSATLLSYTPLATHILYSTIWLDVWPEQRIKNLGSLYAIPDFVSLLLVRRMGWTTIFHHVCVCVFNFVSVNNDYSEDNICRLLVVYAVFSTFAYLVNLLLASRFLGFTKWTSVVLSGLALIIYFTCCSINWAWQIYYTRKLIIAHNHYSIYIYIALIMMVVWDDLVLMKWLWHNIRKKIKQLAQRPDGGQKKKD